MNQTELASQLQRQEWIGPAAAGVRGFGRQPRDWLTRALLHLVLLAGGGAVVLPFLWTITTSLKPLKMTYSPPYLIPTHFEWQNYVVAWEAAPFPRFYLNTTIMAVSIVIGQLTLCSMAAYAFARLEFPGRDLVLNFMLGTMMIPGAVTLIPAYVLMTKLKLLDTYWSLILPGIVSSGAIFMLTQFFKSIPRDLEEAALIDGASQLQIYKDVILPLARPALLTVFILQFQGMWNAFMGPLLYLSSPRMWVLNVALSVFKQQYKAQWNLTLVGAMFNAIPVLLLFFFFSKYYIEGVSYAGVKG